MKANILDFPLELQKFLYSLYFLMSLRCYSGGGKETPWETTPTRQPEGLFPGHYTSACHLCYFWNYCPILIIRVRLWQLFPPLAGFPAASYPGRAGAWSQQGFICWIPRYLCARQKKNTDSLQPAHHMPSPVSIAFIAGAVFVGTAWLPPTLPPGG